MAGQKENATLSTDGTQRFIDPNLFGRSQVGTPGYMGGEMTPGDWMKIVTANQHPISGNPALVDQYGYPSPSVPSTPTSTPEVGGTNPLTNASVALGRYATGEGQNRILGADISDMAAGTDEKFLKNAAGVRHGLSSDASITGEGGWQKLPNGQTIAGLTSDKQKQGSLDLEGQLMEMAKPGGMVRSKDVLKYKDPGVMEKIGRYGALGAGIFGAMGKGGISSVVTGAKNLLHLGGGQPNYNDYGTKWTYDENGKIVPANYWDNYGNVDQPQQGDNSGGQEDNSGYDYSDQYNY